MNKNYEYEKSLQTAAMHWELKACVALQMWISKIKPGAVVEWTGGDNGGYAEYDIVITGRNGNKIYSDCKKRPYTWQQMLDMGGAYFARYKACKLAKLSRTNSCIVVIACNDKVVIALVDCIRDKVKETVVTNPLLGKRAEQQYVITEQNKIAEYYYNELN